MTTSDVIRHVRPDLDGLDERTERLRKDVMKRAEATREDVMKRTEATREQLAELAGEVGGELGERAVAARETLVDRYHEVERDLPTEEIATKAKLGAWKALRAGLTGLLTLPGLAVRGLGALSGVADDLAVRGADVSERGRDLAASVPRSKAQRRRSRRKTAGVASLGLVVGAVIGWTLAGRKQTMVTYEPTLPTNWEPVADPAHPQDPAPHVTTSQATTETGGAGSGVVDVRSEAEAPEPGRGA